MKAHTVGDLKNLAMNMKCKGEDASAVRDLVQALEGIRSGTAVMDGRPLAYQL